MEKPHCSRQGQFNEEKVVCGSKENQNIFLSSSHLQVMCDQSCGSGPQYMLWLLQKTNVFYNNVPPPPLSGFIDELCPVVWNIPLGSFGQLSRLCPYQDFVLSLGHLLLSQLLKCEH